MSMGYVDNGIKLYVNKPVHFQPTGGHIVGDDVGNLISTLLSFFSEDILAGSEPRSNVAIVISGQCAAEYSI